MGLGSARHPLFQARGCRSTTSTMKRSLTTAARRRVSTCLTTRSASSKACPFECHCRYMAACLPSCFVSKRLLRRPLCILAGLLSAGDLWCPSSRWTAFLFLLLPFSSTCSVLRCRIAHILALACSSSGRGMSSCILAMQSVSTDPPSTFLMRAGCDRAIGEI